MLETQTTGNLIGGTYSIGLVLLSYVIAVLASFTALDLAQKIKDSSGLAKNYWTAGCALSIGCGIWSMHFTGMLALQMPMGVSYELGLTILSLMLAVVVSGFGLFYCSAPPILPRKIAVGGPIMGLGIAAMHYSGMAAMEIRATIHYNLPLFALSVVIAVSAATAALWLLVYNKNNPKMFNVLSSLLMGLAIFGMHYTGMAATTFKAEGPLLDNIVFTRDSKLLVAGISIFITFILGAALSASRLQEAFHRLIILKEKAEQASRAKSQFLSKVSHELRTPLNAILGFAQLLKHDPNLSEAHDEYVQQILKSGNHLLDLINDILDLVKIENNKLNISIEEAIDVPPLVSQLVSLSQPMATEHNVIIRNNVPETFSAQVLGDKIRVRQVLLNLISNAIKYNRPQGEVTLDCNLKDDTHVELIVSDTGFGITPENISKLFKAFERLDAQNSSVQGMGIGLSICKDLIQKMNGTIHVSSEVGQGSRFTVLLPQAEGGSFEV